MQDTVRHMVMWRVDWRAARLVTRESRWEGIAIIYARGDGTIS